MDEIEEIIAGRREYWINQRIIRNMINDRARMSFDKTQSRNDKRQIS